MKLLQLEEQIVEGLRLGRHVEHDPRSLAFAWEESGAGVRSVRHLRHGGWFNQGSIGSCTGNAAGAAVNTDPLFAQDPHKILVEKDALSIYERATVVDGYPGVYPPDDTGSSGLAVAKVCVERGYIKKYLHAFTLAQALDALMAGPIIFGTKWYSSMDQPNADGEVTVGGYVRGGHEIMARQYIMVGSSPSNDDEIWFDNSWSLKWGVRGRFCMKVGTFDQLRQDDGDVTILLG